MRDDRPYGSIVWIAASCILALKALLSWHTYGTNDITSWFDYARYVSTRDMFSIYEAIPAYNHPPLVSLWLRALMWVTAGDPTYFPQLFRIVPIAADFGSAIVLWKISRTYFPAGGALLRTMIAVTSPILVMVSGFHGNTDPVFGFLLLLAGYLLAVKRKLVAAALVLALAVNVKIVPILALPAFFFWIPSNSQRLRFSLSFGGAALLGYLAHLLTVPRLVVRNIFTYAGIGKIWGFGALLNEMENYRGLGILLVAVSVLCFAFWFGWRSGPKQTIETLAAAEGLNLFRAMALAYVCFLAFTSGFGVQYLSWLAALVVFLDISLAIFYTLSGSVFLFLAYTYWSGGFPWGYANSWEAGAWPQSVTTMGYVTWACTLALMVQSILARRSAKDTVA
jgi:hypothetical protein